MLNNLKKYFVEGQQIRCVVKREGKKHTILSIISKYIGYRILN